ncbi:Type III secretion exporter [Candidatus Sulfopaludibacter sp. SbA3]|nr:Type III secretion exporter [Candidatus Sulfopaludibacter sp. SbA3]
MADPQKTEQPTKKRLDKAREEGQYPSARQFIGGVQFCVFVFLLQKRGHDWLEGTAQAMRRLLERAFSPELSAQDLVKVSFNLAYRCFLPLLEAGALLVVLTLALQLGVTKMGFTIKKLAPDFKRLSPISKLKQLPHQNLPALVQALILLPLFGGAIYAVVTDQLDTYMALPLASVTAGVRQVTDSLQGLLWKGAALFFVFGCVELFREKRRQMSELRMSKQEIKDEMKESEGNPQIKAKIRGLRRDQARQRMMQAIPTATAVVVNPTHFAVALRYDPQTMVAPLVVAKGKNYLALRIRQRAIENQIPLMKTPPLAQALYKTVNVGQEIPPNLYRAVAEILAYIFKVMNRK